MWPVLTICMLVLSLSQAVEVITNGTSGQKCPRRRCLYGLADCMNYDTCVCRPPGTLYTSNGDSGCYNGYDFYGECFNDPKVRNFNNETSDFPFPCRYLLTSVTTNLRIRKKDVGYCKCDLHAFNLKNKGKLYVGGFDFACRITNNALYQQAGFSSRIVGIAHSGVYTYMEEGNPGYMPNGPWTPNPVHIIAAGISISSSYDTVNNQAKFMIPECGWKITFVAYDVIMGLLQEQKPGLTFAINSGLQPYFHEHNRVIATAPQSLGGQTFASLAVPPFTISETLIIRAFTSYVVQNHPGAPPQCTSIGIILKACSQPRLNKTAKGCFWMPNVPKFSRCLDPTNNTEPLLELYQRCTGVYCVGAPPCNSFRSDVVATGCSTIMGIPQLTNINNGNFCSY